MAVLLTELGYPTTDDRLRSRLRQGHEDSSTTTLVAEAGGEVVGCMSLTFTPYFPDGSTMCRITALVVGSRHRGRGVGSVLVARAIDEARARACATLEVTTAERRTDAQRFYERGGFSRASARFVRSL